VGQVSERQRANRGLSARILVVGGGHVGFTLAMRLRDRLRRGEADVTVVDPHSHLTYQPLLAEAGAGNVEPRHVAVPLRRMLHRTRVLTAELVNLSHRSRRAVVRLASGEHRELSYDHVVLAPGSVSRTLPIPGLAELGVGFKSLGEAVYLRNRIIERLDFAASTADPAARRRALTFVVVGAGYSGVEALGELSDMAASIVPVYDNVDRADLRWVLVEAGSRILPEVSPELAAYTLRLLRRRGIDVRLNTTILSCVDGLVELNRGDPFETDTLVWTAGVRPAPVLADTDLPLDREGRVLADPLLRVRDTPGAWAAGDCAAVPDLTAATPGALCAPTAQHGIRQARRLADNIVAELRGYRPRPYRHRYAGTVASLGRFQGIAEIYGVRMCGLPAWLLHRTYHLLRLPSMARRARVLADWSLAAAFPRDVVSLGEIQHPREMFVRGLAERVSAAASRHTG
jgi:NADH dehydrogenase